MLSKYDEIRARRARGEDQGFSLIELLVVVVIMGILIAIAVPVYLNYQNNAKKKAVEADVRNAIPAVEQCIADNGGTITGVTGGASASGTLSISGCGTGTQRVNVSTGNTMTITVSGSSYTIANTRADPTFTATYDSSTGVTTKS